MNVHSATSCLGLGIAYRWRFQDSIDREWHPMGHLRWAGVALLASVAMAVGASAASAASPEWGYCGKAVPTNTGNYANSTCTEASEPGKGKFEILEGIGKGKAFKGKLGLMIWHMVIPGKGDFQTECASGSDEGSVAAPNKVVGVKIKLLKCKTSSSVCKTEGGASETITTEVLAGELGWLDKEADTAGIELSNEAAPGSGLLAQFECEGFAKERWIGSVIGEQKGDVAAPSKESEIDYSVANYLGEVSPGYTPLVNPVQFEGSPTQHVLSTELNGPETENKWAPVGGLPTGLQGAFVNKGENLIVR